MLNFLFAAVTALLLIFTVPRFEIGWLAPVALVPLILALAREPRWRWRFLLGWLAGVLYWFGVCYWIQGVLYQYGGLGQFAAWASFLLFCGAKALHLGVFSALAGYVLRAWYAIPAIAALWTGIERTHGPLGFTWYLLGNSAVDMEAPMRLAPYVGIYGLSFILVMMNVAVVLVILRRPRREILWLALLPLLYLFPSMPPPEKPERVAAVVQPNIAEETRWTPESVDAMQRSFELLSLQAALKADEPQVDLVIWPEVPAPLYYYEDPVLRKRVADVARMAGAYVLMGTVAHAPDASPLNSAVMVKPGGEAEGRYDKIFLVPFGEFVPPLFGFINQITTEAGEFKPGKKVVTFPVNGQGVGPFICYESAFPHLVRKIAGSGAHLLVNLSNDGYFARSAAREQHLNIVRMRAAENRRWIVRATNDGITVSIDPAGRIRQRLPAYERLSGRLSYSYVSNVTFYTRYGDWFAWSCLAAGLLLVLVSQIPKYRPEELRG